MNELHVVDIRDGQGNSKSVKHPNLSRRTKIIDLGEVHEIRTEIPASSPNGSEHKLLELAFGANYSKRLEALESNAYRNLHRDTANEKL